MSTKITELMLGFHDVVLDLAYEMKDPVARRAIEDKLMEVERMIHELEQSDEGGS